jgi:two-component system chemotaxis response regulator CheB
MSQAAPRIRVLIVDDSALVRAVLARGLAQFPDIEVVGSARDPYEARDLLVKLRPDVMTLDVEMPRMDGISFLRKLMAVLPTPTVVLSSLTQKTSRLAAEALEAGAVAVLAKPAVGVEKGLSELMNELAIRLRKAARTRVERMERRGSLAEAAPAPATALDATTDKVIGIGASTGGVAALGRILPQFPPSMPGIVIVQHMAAGFTRDFARRLDQQCQMRIAEAEDGDRVLRGHILVAPGGTRHCEVRRQGGEYRVRLVAGAPVCGHVPSVDVLFESLARCAGKNAAGCILTGMGADGARGLALMRQAGSRTFAQDKSSSAVWGMPSAAVELGGAERVVPLEEVPTALHGWANQKSRSSLAG